jgi:hypothetical protein
MSQTFEKLIARWTASGAAERANKDTFWTTGFSKARFGGTISTGLASCLDSDRGEEK